MKIGRRRAIGIGIGAATVGAGVFAEWASFRGAFDHRRAAYGDGRGGTKASPAGVASAERYERSLRSLGERASTSAIVHVGHSTHLVALGDARILTDPWFYDPAFGALTHEVAPAVAPEALGRLDAILVTHDHADHADLRAMDRMDKRAAVICATSDLAARIRARGFGDVSVLGVWESRRLTAGPTAERGPIDVLVTATPAEHDIYEIGFVVEALAKKVYFAGDTRLFGGIDAIAERFKPDVSILPVDGTRLTGGALHVMTPDDAVAAAKKLASRIVVPSHAEACFSDPIAGTFLASTVDRARFIFAEAMAKAMPEVRAMAPEPGEAIGI